MIVLIRKIFLQGHQEFNFPYKLASDFYPSIQIHVTYIEESKNRSRINIEKSLIPYEVKKG